tara:strand:- start:1893 stop:2003 length:111 start_codon:yes stop_codon:yes gene_type:complete
VRDQNEVFLAKKEDFLAKVRVHMRVFLDIFEIYGEK